MSGVIDSEIQLAQPSDCEAVSACVHAAYAHYIQRLGREPAPMLADYRTLIEHGVVYVLREPSRGALCGVLVIETQHDCVFVENVAVHPEYQHRGLGRRLLSFAEHQAVAGGLNEVRLYTNELMTENIAYYQHLGFEELERRMDHGYRRVFMRRVLQAST